MHRFSQYMCVKPRTDDIMTMDTETLRSIIPMTSRDKTKLHMIDFL
ncbi:hypothetical protein CGLO_08510 [Colletotrichum gloeosporioides Cg-14]|uniref:Uncharacterized protein n=1 Tax=Colletotrichum gloeosporioides (strain Cg-14) TaxID=1237896 RepID=T0LJR6_COLGC|nr:hypothetical protein CGLO_08510 [Colletotrichum gloeosporioides Cg-14]